jgi:hypothetical protein
MSHKMEISSFIKLDKDVSNETFFSEQQKRFERENPKNLRSIIETPMPGDEVWNEGGIQKKGQVHLFQK